MRGGFSFCGVDIAKWDLEYAPELTDTYVWGPAGYNVNEESFEAHDGGYFYGTTMKPKEFTLRCYYEEQHVNRGIIANITSFFYRGRTGRLIFKRRPWVWYNATVVSIDYSKMTNTQNGVITIGMKAYYPFARHDTLWMLDDPPNQADKEHNSALLSETMTPANKIITGSEPLTEATSFMLYNGGTEKAAVAVEIAGDVGEGVTIYNRTTGQSCGFVAMSKAITSDVGNYFICDSLNGKTMLTDGTNHELSFLYHDGGFIDLKPAFPIDRNIEITMMQNSIIITSREKFDETMAGKYVWLRNAWHKITAVLNESTAYIDEVMPEETTEVTTIAEMNELEVVPTSTMSLTRLNLIYKPTFH